VISPNAEPGQPAVPRPRQLRAPNDPFPKVIGRPLQMACVREIAFQVARARRTPLPSGRRLLPAGRAAVTAQAVQPSAGLGRQYRRPSPQGPGVSRLNDLVDTRDASGVRPDGWRQSAPGCRPCDPSSGSRPAGSGGIDQLAHDVGPRSPRRACGRCPSRSDIVDGRAQDRRCRRVQDQTARMSMFCVSIRSPRGFPDAR